jgi:hypothetical protein
VKPGFQKFRREGKLNGAPEIALKVPFALASIYAGGNACDFSKDLSTHRLLHILAVTPTSIF